MQPKAMKILEISNYPPPICGWAMQTKLLTQELRRRGAICRVLNINESRRIKSPEYTDVQNGLDYLWKLLKFSLHGYRFHSHVNAESKKGYLLALAAHLVGRAFGRPAIMTFHGGLPQTYFPRHESRLLRWAYAILFLTAGRITCDSPPIQRAIQSYGIERRPVVPFACFSPQYLEFQPRPLERKVEEFLTQHRPVFLCNVCYRPEYALEELLAAMELFSAQCSQAGFIWAGFPNKELPLVRGHLQALAEGPPANLLVLGNLDHDSFLTLLTRSTALIRPCACDGVSASVLESLALGIPVVAAENGRRPAGVVTYRFADPDDLGAELRYVMNHYDAVKQATRLEEMSNPIGQVAEWILESESA